MLLLLAASIDFPRPAGRAQRLFVIATLAAFTVRHVDIAVNWVAAAKELHQQLPSLDVLPIGAVVHNFVWMDPDPVINKKQRHFAQFATLSIPRRQAIYPQLASTPKDVWPLHARPDYYYGHLETGESFDNLNWDRFRTYGLTPAERASRRAELGYSSYPCGLISGDTTVLPDPRSCVVGQMGERHL